MHRYRSKARLIAAAATVGVLALAACSSGGGSGGKSSGLSTNANGSNKGVSAAFNAANVGFVNQSTKTGGSLNLVATGDCDSWDPVDTYYAWCWNMQRLITRTLVGYSNLPGANNVKIEPDLASSLGEHNTDFTQWTYKLKSGVKWEDGSPVTTAQIKYGLERVFATDLFSQGPSSYFLCLLSKCDADGAPAYKGPYKDKSGLSTITTPDDNTIIFKLGTSTPDFDYLMTLPNSGPVKTTEGGSQYFGSKYKLHPLSTGPFKIDSYQPEQKIVFSRNSNWSQDTDTIRKPLADKITISINTNGDSNDKELQAGTADAPADGGVQQNFQSDIARDANLKKNADNPVTGFTRYVSIFPSVKPFDNIHCRIAVQYAANKSDMRRARGGTYGGDIAHTMSPSVIPGYDKTADPYPSGSGDTGDLTKAKEELKKCGMPNGFSTKIAYQTTGRNPQTFTALQQSLSRVGIKATGLPHAQSGYFGGYIGVPATVKSVGIGLALAGWASDYPTGGGFWTSIAASYAPPGGGNYTQINDKSVDANLATAAKSTGRHDEEFKAIDKQVMSLAVDLPYIYDKTLYYRNPRLTNVRINFALGSYYDFVNMGVSDGK